jgi:hypothetical protein
MRLSLLIIIYYIEKILNGSDKLTAEQFLKLLQAKKLIEEVKG